MRYKCTNCEDETKTVTVYVNVAGGDGEEIKVCSKCYGIESTLISLCDEPGCTYPPSAGTPYPGGYKIHCHRHPPKENQ